MTSVHYVSHFVCLLLVNMGVCVVAQTHHQLSSPLQQDKHFVSVRAGDSLTLRCFYNPDAARFYWYKLVWGQKPQLISTVHKYKTNGTFHDEFKNNPRFMLFIENNKNHLKILNLHISDSATYYCASGYSYKFEFGEGTTVSVEGPGSNIQTSVHQSASETIHPGGSVSLNCSVQTGSCDGEHSVYWFRNSEESHPGLVYTQGGRDDRCERKPNTQTHSCVYKLMMENLNVSHAGTYYCAVVSCGRILFGNGTKMDLKYEEDSVVSMYLLSGALAFATFLSVLQAFLLCVIFKKNSLKNTVPPSRMPHPSRIAEVDHSEDSVHYAALRHKKVNKLRKQVNESNECVYSSIIL